MRRRNRLVLKKEFQPQPKTPRETKSLSGVRGKNWTFPKETLEAAIQVAKAIEEKNGGNPMPASEVAKAVGYRQAEDWRFLDLLRAANLYGLVQGTGAAATIVLEKLGTDIVAPSSPDDRKKALLASFRKVDDFRKVEEYYKSKKIPEDEYFLNTLTREFGIDRDRVEKFKEVFLGTLTYLKQFDARDEATPEPQLPVAEPSVALESPPAKLPEEHRVRKFLDTCFVLMPFGGYFDRYYQEIYTKAINDAGFESVRADEIFTTGSVVDQIWEHISKAKVLLADLTDKNPNVFYEVGLAHAKGKPVVLTAAKLEDVPFDLRHLRMVIYDVREPDWAAKLFGLLIDHLKSAKADPLKSIPHAFRPKDERQ